MKKLLNEIFSTTTNFYFYPRHPVVGRFYITSRCNLKCVFCEMGTHEPGSNNVPELNTSQWMEIISILKNWGVSRLYITGGEPFLRKDIWDILLYSQKIGLPVSTITTNGTLFGNLDHDKVNILNNCVDCVAISLDSADKNIHDGIRRVKGSFNKIQSFLTSTPAGFKPRIHLVCVVSRHSINQIIPLVNYAIKYKVSFIGFQPVNFFSNFPGIVPLPEKNSFLPCEDGILLIETELEKAQSLLSKSGIQNNLELLRFWVGAYFRYARTDKYFFSELVNRFNCFSMYQQILVDWAGNILPCSLLPPVGNILTNNIIHSWRYDLQPIRSNLKQKSYFNECRSCFCEFPLNLRYSMITNPVGNRNILINFLRYYWSRISTQY